MATKSIQLRIDEGLKDRAESVLEELGLDMPTALRLFLKKVVNTRAIPFRISLEEEGFSQTQVREILASRAEARAGAGLSGPFRSPEETQEFLDSLKRR